MVNFIYEVRRLINPKDDDYNEACNICINQYDFKFIDVDCVTYIKTGPTTSLMLVEKETFDSNQKIKVKNVILREYFKHPEYVRAVDELREEK